MTQPPEASKPAARATWGSRETAKSMGTMTPSQKSTYDCFPAVSPSALTNLRGPLPTWGLSTESASQQWGLCEAIVRQAPDKQALLAPAAGLLAWAWQQRPLAALVTTLLAALDAQQNFLGQPTRDLVRSLKKKLTVVQDKAAWEAVLAGGQWPVIEAFLLKAFRGPAALAWLGETWEELAAMGDHELARRLLALAAPKGPLGLRLRAELAFHQGSTDEALALAQGLTATPFAPFGDYLAAHLQGRAGLREQAAATLAGLWRDMPWHTNLTLKLFDLASPKDNVALPPDPTAILVYSWNKADLLRQTLESVFAGDIGGNPVFVLDNGSTDATPDMLAHMAARYGPRLTLVRLPVNVGAPAARNWLLSLPQVRAQAYAAFLDDDVLLPGNWLATLLAAAQEPPAVRSGGLLHPRARRPPTGSSRPTTTCSPACPARKARPRVNACAFSTTAPPTLTWACSPTGGPACRCRAAAICSTLAAWTPWAVSTCASPPPSSTTWTATCAAFWPAARPSMSETWPSTMCSAPACARRRLRLRWPTFRATR